MPVLPSYIWYTHQVILNLHELQAEAELLQYGTSPLLPTDDPSAWPLLNGREATPAEVEALRVKHIALERAAKLFRQTLSGAEENDLIVMTEDDPLCFTRLSLPAILPEQLTLALTTAERLLRAGKHKAAVAQLRLAEVLLRLANGWGHAEVQGQVDGFMGLEKGERAAALILTTDVSRSKDYGDVAQHSVTVMSK